MTQAWSLSVAAGDDEAFQHTLRRLVADQVASRIAAKDHTLWGLEAEHEASIRLGWVDAASVSEPLVASIEALRDDLAARGLTRIVLCGMGGSSLAPELICDTAGVPLVVLDSSHPDQVRAALGDLGHTVVVVSSKSGSTLETDSQRRVFEHAFESAGISPRERIVVVTDPGSPLQEQAEHERYRVFTADATVGGRYSALTAFGLVPSGLAGAEIGSLLAQARQLLPALAEDSPDNPALRLGALLGVAAVQGVDKLVLANAGSPYHRLGDWIEQLVAESTGKQGKGVLPVVVASPAEPSFHPGTPDSVLVAFGPEPVTAVPASGWSATLDASLGEHLLLWEFATAVAGRVLGIDPFDQPDVESAKAAARSLLDGKADHDQPLFVEGPFTVSASPGWLPERVRSTKSAVSALLGALDPEHGYVAVQAYTDRLRDAGLAGVQGLLAEVTKRPVTFGWGPRFLHSTGQYHKGGPATGVFLQITGAVEEDLDVPHRHFTLGEFIRAQAVGDASVLAAAGRPVLRIEVEDPAALRTLATLIETL